jgi:hypothetical protein
MLMIRLDPPHPSSLADEQLLARCRLGKGRTSGPGGQHRNKVETLVTITHEPTGVTAHAGERRSAADNRRVAIFRLRLRLAIETRCDVPDGDCRSQLWKSRCGKGGRIACNPTHRDYPAMLAEALDMIAACDLDPAKAASRLGCTTSQLIKLVKDHRPAMESWNAQRAERGLHPLK